MRDYRGLLNDANSIEALGIITEWMNAGKENKRLNALSKAVVGMVAYINDLRQEREGFDMVVDQQNEKILNLRKKVRELKYENEILKDKLEFLEEQ